MSGTTRRSFSHALQGSMALLTSWYQWVKWQNIGNHLPSLSLFIINGCLRASSGFRAKDGEIMAIGVLCYGSPGATLPVVWVTAPSFLTAAVCSWSPPPPHYGLLSSRTVRTTRWTLFGKAASHEFQKEQLVVEGRNSGVRLPWVGVWLRYSLLCDLQQVV